MICQCRLINSKKCNIVTNCTILVGDVDNGGGYALVGTGSIWEISVSFPQFFCEHKTALKMTT